MRIETSVIFFFSKPTVDHDRKMKFRFGSCKTSQTSSNIKREELYDTSHCRYICVLMATFCKQLGKIVKAKPRRFENSVLDLITLQILIGSCTEDKRYSYFLLLTWVQKTCEKFQVDIKSLSPLSRLSPQKPTRLQVIFGISLGAKLESFSSCKAVSLSRDKKPVFHHSCLQL